MNQAEIEIGLFSPAMLASEEFRITDAPQRESRVESRINRVGVTINWKFDRKAAAKSLLHNQLFHAV